MLINLGLLEKEFIKDQLAMLKHTDLFKIPAHFFGDDSLIVNAQAKFIIINKYADLPNVKVELDTIFYMLVVP